MTTTPKSRPILFSPAMVRAILNGKTQTRRVVKPQPKADAMEVFAWFGGELHSAPNGCADDGCYIRDRNGLKHLCACPYGVPGDRLWVRETFYIDHTDVSDRGRLPKEMPPGWDDLIYYRADGECCDQIPECACDEIGKPRWRPSIHMPRWASRITLEVADGRIERLCDISDADAIAEGYASAKDFLVGDWAAPLRKLNPWVWAVGFRATTDAPRAERAARGQARTQTGPDAHETPAESENSLPAAADCVGESGIFPEG